MENLENNSNRDSEFREKIENKIIKIIQNIAPFDELEEAHIADALNWIKSGADLFRVQKPDIPAKHLVSYFLPIDSRQDKILLIDHIKAQLWLPAGGHVEPNEDPKVTVEREIKEELNTDARFISEQPLFLSQAITVGLTAGHTDVSFWYGLEGDSDVPLQYDPKEFNGYKWFDYKEILGMPIEKLDPHLHRFVKKWISIKDRISRKSQ
ncbi:MAG: NUDIX hydrolase [Candidatus Portnoybacteria bacterium]|nr:NUDIX hydrolase [Candidatus Portnoybacteria bacterium]